MKFNQRVLIDFFYRISRNVTENIGLINKKLNLKKSNPKFYENALKMNCTPSVYAVIYFTKDSSLFLQFMFMCGHFTAAKLL